jgi:TolB-like protein
MTKKGSIGWVWCWLVLSAVGVGAEEDKCSVVVVSFDAIGVSEMECEVITERFRAELSRTDRFLVTSKQQTVTELAKTKDVTILGKQLGVDRVLVGSVSKMGTTFSVVANLIDPLSGKTVKTVVEDHSGGIDVLLREVIRRASERLADYEGTGYLAFVGPRGGDTIDHLTVWINDRQLIRGVNFIGPRSILRSATFAANLRRWLKWVWKRH